MWKFLENSIKSLANPHVAIAVVALTPWLVISLLGYFVFKILSQGG